MNQKGNSLILIIVGVLIISGFLLGLLYLKSNQKTQNNAKEERRNVMASPSAEVPPPYQSGNKNSYYKSPMETYKTVTNLQGDYRVIAVLDEQDNVIVSDLVKSNYEKIGYGTKFGCQCGTDFDKWIDDSHFTIKIVNGNGEEYQYLVNAPTGQIVEESFKKIK